MKGRHVVVLAIAVGVFFGSLLGIGSVAAQDPTLRVTDITDATDGFLSVEIMAEDFEEPGLGAWTVDVTYEPGEVILKQCRQIAPSSVCNDSFASDTARLSGATAGGLVGDTRLAELVFECIDAEGTSDVTITPVDVADATVGSPTAVAVTVINGTVDCAASAGGGEGLDDGDGAAGPPGSIPGAGGAAAGPPASLPAAGQGSAPPGTDATAPLLALVLASGALMSVGALLRIRSRS
jgi:hypothetical protein